MLPAAVTVRTHPRNHVWPDGPDHPHEVGQYLLSAPLLERLVPTEGVAEIDGAGEILLGPVEPMGGQQLLGAQRRQRIEELGPDLVLPAVAARSRDKCGPDAFALAQQGQHPVVLVVGMRGRHHERAGGVELAQHQTKRGPTVDAVGRLCPQTHQSHPGHQYAQRSAQHQVAHLHDFLSIHRRDFAPSRGPIGKLPGPAHDRGSACRALRIAARSR